VHHSIIADLQAGNAETRRRLAVYCLKARPARGAPGPPAAAAGFAELRRAAPPRASTRERASAPVRQASLPAAMWGASVACAHWQAVVHMTLTVEHMTLTLTLAAHGNHSARRGGGRTRTCRSAWWTS